MTGPQFLTLHKTTSREGTLEKIQAPRSWFLQSSGVNAFPDMFPLLKCHIKSLSNWWGWELTLHDILSLIQIWPQVKSINMWIAKDPHKNWNSWGKQTNKKTSTHWEAKQILTADLTYANTMRNTPILRFPNIISPPTAPYLVSFLT